MRSVESEECGKRGVWKMRSVENEEELRISRTIKSTPFRASLRFYC